MIFTGKKQDLYRELPFSEISFYSKKMIFTGKSKISIVNYHFLNLVSLTNFY